MKSFTVKIVVCMLFAFWTVPAHAEIVDGIAAVVNGDVITYYELNKMLRTYVEALPQELGAQERENAIREAKAGLLDKLIDESILTQEATKSGIAVKDEEINAMVQDTLRDSKLTLERFKEELQKTGSSYDDYRRTLKEHLMKMRLASREINSKMIISDDEIGEYYAKNRDIYEGKETVKIRQILFPVSEKAAQALRDKIQESAETLVSRLKSGQSFEEIMQDSRTMGAEVGADLGYIEKGVMMPEVDQVAFKLKPGEFSPVIASSAGYQIIQVIDKRGAGIKPLKRVREEIQNEISRQKSNQKIQEWIKDLRKKSYVSINIKSE